MGRGYSEAAKLISLVAFIFLTKGTIRMRTRSLPVVVGIAALAALGLAGCSSSAPVEDAPTPESMEQAEIAPEETAAPVEEPELSVCDTYIAAASEDGTVTDVAEVNPADYPAPLGVTFPVAPDCAVQLNIGGGQQQVQFIWEHGNIDALEQAMLAAGFENTFSKADRTQNQYTRSDALTWLYMGSEVPASGMNDDTIMFPFPA